MTTSELSAVACIFLGLWLAGALLVRREYLQSFRNALEKKSIQPEALHVDLEAVRVRHDEHAAAFGGRVLVVHHAFQARRDARRVGDVDDDVEPFCRRAFQLGAGALAHGRPGA